MRPELDYCTRLCCPVVMPHVHTAPLAVPSAEPTNDDVVMGNLTRWLVDRARQDVDRLRDGGTFVLHDGVHVLATAVLEPSMPLLWEGDQA